MNVNGDKQAYARVIEYISGQVDAGMLGTGDRLPSERRLVELLGIGRNSIREALEILCTLGILDRKQGDGTYIRENFEDWFVLPMTLGYLLSDTRGLEIFEFRNMIEAEIASLAAERITVEEITELQACFQRMQEETDVRTTARLDKQFHSLLARASGNALIINSYHAIDHVLDLFIYDMRVKTVSENRMELVEFVHRNLYEAVVEHDVVEAREAMRRHMNIIRKYFE